MPLDLKDMNGMNLKLQELAGLPADTMSDVELYHAMLETLLGMMNTQITLINLELVKVKETLQECLKTRNHSL